MYAALGLHGLELERILQSGLQIGQHGQRSVGAVHTWGNSKDEDEREQEEESGGGDEGDDQLLKKV